MRALVTGSAGFVGRHTVAELRRRGWDVAGVDVVRTSGFIAWHGNALQVFDGSYYPGERFDLVVHAAAVEPHRAAIDTRPLHLAANVHLDAAMFEWAARTGQGRVLYLSSSAAYPVGYQAGHTPYRLHEDDADPDRAVSAELLAALGSYGPLRPDSRYGWTKLTGEQMARAAGEAGLAVHVVRPFSGYGEDQSLDFPFPAIVARARTGDLSVWGPPGQTRDWIHIDDVVAGALEVVDRDVREPVNLCTGVGTEMGDLARMVARAAGHDGEVTYLADRPTGVMYRVGDPTRMEQIYKPRVSLAEGIERALRRST